MFERIKNTGYGLHLEMVMKRLEKYTPEKLALFDSLDPNKVYSKIKLLENLSKDDLVKDRGLLIRRLNNNRLKDDQYHLLAHLFLTTRQTVKKGKFDVNREKINIDGVVSLLCGDTKEGKTGKGKSSVIAPIDLLFRSLWSSSYQPRIFSPPNRNLLNEAIQRYKKLRKIFIDSLPDFQKTEVEEKTKFTLLKLKRSKVGQEESLIDVLTGEKDSFVTAFYEGYSVIFSDHKTTIFSTPKGKGIDIDQPTTLFDEIHMLANESFISTSGEHNSKAHVTPETLTNSPIGENIASYVLTKLVSLKLKENDGNFDYQGNELILNERAYQSLEKFNTDFNAIFTAKAMELIENHVLPGIKFNLSDKEKIVQSIFNRVVSFWDSLLTNNSLKVDEGINPRLNYLEILAENITSVMSGVKPGESYITLRRQPLVREKGRGTLLPSHKFTDDVNFLIRAIDDKQIYSYFTQTNRLNYGYSFPTWLVDAAKGNVQGLSANLFRRDLWTGKIRKGKLATVLETFTSGKVIPAEEEAYEKLPLPDPEILRDTNGLFDYFSNPRSLPNGQSQEMIICYNDYLAEKILNNVKSQEESIGLITSTTSEREIKRMLKDFAEGRLKKIITSGRVGYGVDIKKRDGTFPDFHITVINPETQTDITQNFGRLRAEKKKENFTIILTEEYLNQISTLFEDKKALPLPFYHSGPEFVRALEDYKLGKNKDKFNELFYWLLDLNETMMVDDYIMKTKLELTFQSKIAPVVSKIKKDLLDQIINDKSSYLGGLINKLLPVENKDFIFKFIGEEIKELLSLPEEALWQDFFDEAVRVKLENPLIAQNDSAVLNLVVGRINELLSSSLKSHYEELFKDKKYINQEISKKTLISRIESYGKLSELIKLQLPFNSIDLSKVESIQVEAIPPFERVEKTDLRTATNPENFIKIGEGKYLVVFNNKKINKQELMLYYGSSLPVPNSPTNFYYIDNKNRRNILSKLASKQSNVTLPDNIYFVFPTVSETDKVATHMIVVDYKKE